MPFDSYYGKDPLEAQHHHPQHFRPMTDGFPSQGNLGTSGLPGGGKREAWNPRLIMGLS